MDEDLFHVPAPERSDDPATVDPATVDLATGDGTYRRKPRIRTVARPVRPALVITAALSLAAAVIVATGWYATDSRTPRVTRQEPQQTQLLPTPLTNVVIDGNAGGGPPLTAPLCEYRSPDRQGLVELPARVEKVPGKTPRLVLQTDHGRIAVLLNGWAGHCAIDSTVSQAVARRLDGLRCAPVGQAKALRCNLSTGYVYTPQLVDLSVGVVASTKVDADGTVHIVLADDPPKPVAVGKRGGLLTVVASAAGSSGGDLVLAYADTTLPAGAFYPTVGEVDEGAELLSLIGSGLTITAATVE